MLFTPHTIPWHCPPPSNTWQLAKVHFWWSKINYEWLIPAPHLKTNIRISCSMVYYPSRDVWNTTNRCRDEIRVYWLWVPTPVKISKYPKLCCLMCWIGAPDPGFLCCPMIVATLDSSYTGPLSSSVKGYVFDSYSWNSWNYSVKSVKSGTTISENIAFLCMFWVV